MLFDKYKLNKNILTEKTGLNSGLDEYNLFNKVMKNRYDYMYKIIYDKLKMLEFIVYLLKDNEKYVKLTPSKQTYLNITNVKKMLKELYLNNILFKYSEQINESYIKGEHDIYYFKLQFEFTLNFKPIILKAGLL